MKKYKKIGLALGSGGLRGFALLGVIKALEKHKISIDLVSGASIGAWVGAHYAMFHDVDTLEKIITENPRDNLPVLFDFSWRGGFVNGKKFESFLRRDFGVQDISHTKTPLAIVATELGSGRELVFHEGRLSTIIRGSCAVPLLFKPVKYQRHLMVDGGLSNPVPCDILREMGADFVIGVNLYHENEFVNKKFTMAKVVLRSSRIVAHNLAINSCKFADVTINPDTSAFLNSIRMKKYFSPEVSQALIKIGEKAAEKMIPQIKAALGR